MDYRSILDTINTIYDDRLTLDNKCCILINGEWGIGKTYTVRQWMEEKSKEYNFKYLSAFGKDSIREFENEIILKILSPVKEIKIHKIKREFDNEIIIKILSLFKKIKYEKIKNRGKNAKLVIKSTSKKAVSQLLSNRLGLVLEASEYVKDISIEDIYDSKYNDKETIVCIDDLERKSENISIRNILGLIERISQNYNVIVIANSNQFSKREQKQFQKYKEKVIDYEFTINELDSSLMENILTQTLSNLDEEQIASILKIYMDPFERRNLPLIRNQLLNIRVYKKYIALIDKVIKEFKVYIEKFELDADTLEACKTVICHYYFNNDIDYEFDGGKNNSSNLREGTLNKIIYSIFKYETYNPDLLIDLFSNDSEISKDIQTIYNLYKLTSKQAKELNSKIQAKINTRDYGYFTTQNRVIAFYDALQTIKYPGDFTEQLLEISFNLYTPDYKQRPDYFNKEDWFDVTLWGGAIPCCLSTSNFINKVNANNKAKYEAFRNSKFEEAFQENNVAMVLQILNDSYISKEADFKKVFNFAEKNLDSEQHSISWKLLNRLLERTNANIPLQYLDNELNQGENFLRKIRLKYLKENLEELEYYREKMEEETRILAEEQMDL